MDKPKIELPIEISLNYPIMVGDERIDKLVISRRPKAKDLRFMDQNTGEVSKSAALLARLTENPESVIDQMDASDFTHAASIVAGFLSESHTSK